MVSITANSVTFQRRHASNKCVIVVIVNIAGTNY